jgi:hypothetical protein
MLEYLVLAIVVIILICGSYRGGQNAADMELMSGFWESSREFNEESGLQMFTFYIGEKRDGEYPSYLLMIEAGDEQNILINEPTSFKITESYKNRFYRNGFKQFYLKFNNLESSLIPSVVSMKFYPQTCKIVISDSTQIYAVFFKNPVLSELEQINKETKILGTDTPDKTCEEISKPDSQSEDSRQTETTSPDKSLQTETL